MTERPEELNNKVIVMNGFSYEEIDKIMRAVKPLFESPRDLIFAKTTETSLTMTLQDLIVDISQDHEYLKQNPPKLPRRDKRDTGSDGSVDSKNSRDADAAGGSST